MTENGENGNEWPPEESEQEENGFDNAETGNSSGDFENASKDGTVHIGNMDIKKTSSIGQPKREAEGVLGFGRIEDGEKRLNQMIETAKELIIHIPIAVQQLTETTKVSELIEKLLNDFSALKKAFLSQNPSLHLAIKIKKIEKFLENKDAVARGELIRDFLIPELKDLQVFFKTQEAIPSQLIEVQRFRRMESHLINGNESSKGQLDSEQEILKNRISAVTWLKELYKKIKLIKNNYDQINREAPGKSRDLVYEDETNKVIVNIAEEMLLLIKILKAEVSHSHYLISDIEDNLIKLKEEPKIELKEGLLKALNQNLANLDNYFRNKITEISSTQSAHSPQGGAGEAIPPESQSEEGMDDDMEEVEGMAGIEHAGFQPIPQVPNVLPHSKPSIITPSDPYIRKKVSEIRQLLKAGRKWEAVEIINDLCTSFKAYPGLWRMKDEEKHNFMKHQEGLNEFTRYLFEEYLTESVRKELSITTNRIFELGPGIGNDAVQLLQRLPNVKEYYAIEASDIAANLARERLKQRAQSDKLLINIKVEEEDFVRRLGEIAHEIDTAKKWILPKSERRIVVSKSALHYFWEDMFTEIMRNIHKIVWAGNGLLILALKTPDAATWKEHIPIESKQGYRVGLHPKEAIVRAFMEKEKIAAILDSVGFDMVNADKFQQTMRNYDFDGKDEAFYFVIARPKKPRESNGEKNN